MEAGFGQGVPGGFGFRNQGDLFAVEGGLVGVAFLVVRGQILGGDAAGGFQRGIEYGAVVIGVARALQQRFGVEHFVELEVQLAFVEQLVSHGGLVGRVKHAVLFSKVPDLMRPTKGGFLGGGGWRKRPLGQNFEAAGDLDGLLPIAGAQLAEQVVDVGLDGAGAD